MLRWEFKDRSEDVLSGSQVHRWKLLNNDNFMPHFQTLVKEVMEEHRAAECLGSHGSNNTSL